MVTNILSSISPISMSEILPTKFAPVISFHDGVSVSALSTRRSFPLSKPTYSFVEVVVKGEILSAEISASKTAFDSYVLTTALADPPKIFAFLSIWGVGLGILLVRVGMELLYKISKFLSSAASFIKFPLVVVLLDVIG